MPVPFVGPSYALAIDRVDLQRSINLYPVVPEVVGAKTPAYMAPTPGLVMFSAEVPPSDVDPLFDKVLLLMHGEGAGFKDSSKYNRSFVVVGGIPGQPHTTTDAFKFGVSSIANNGSLAAAETAAIDLAGTNFSIQYWFRTTNPSANMRLFSMTSAFGSTAEQHGFFARISGVGAGRAVQHGTDLAANIAYVSATVADGNWHYVVVESDTSGNGFMAFDGNIVATNLAGVNPLAQISAGGTLSFDLGAGRNAVANGLAEPFDGEIDELRITAALRHPDAWLTPATPIPLQTAKWPDQ